ncbi:MAG: hypothetical protein M3082_03890 [Candidatus Dormibacteraeota bacterium]|nr:hypothetical protein [Candidatus Dormibacteraeota bacterium]
MIGDFRRLLATPCQECIVDIVAWRDEADIQGWPMRGSVNVGLISSHDVSYFRSWRGKFHRLRLALNGESYPWLELLSRDQAEEFVVALTEAIDVSFPA